MIKIFNKKFNCNTKNDNLKFKEKNEKKQNS